MWGGGNIYSSPTTQLDESLSDTSINAVQNKAIKAELDKKLCKDNPYSQLELKWVKDTLILYNPTISENSYCTQISSSAIRLINDDGDKYIDVDASNPDIPTIRVNNGKKIINLVFEDKLLYMVNGSENIIATEDYVKSAIAAIASYDDTAF